MWFRKAIHLTVIASAMLVNAEANATISVTGGNLHVYAKQGTFFSAGPFDVPFVPPSTSAAADILPPDPDWYAHETVSFVNGQITVSTRIEWQFDTDNASGFLNITEDAPETMSMQIYDGYFGVFYVGGVTLTRVGGGTVYSDVGFGGGGAFLHQQSIALTPGQYTLTWNTDGRAQTGFSGPGGFDFIMSVPEPSSLASLGVIGVAALMRRRRVK